MLPYQPPPADIARPERRSISGWYLAAVRLKRWVPPTDLHWLPRSQSYPVPLPSAHGNQQCQNGSSCGWLPTPTHTASLFPSLFPWHKGQQQAPDPYPPPLSRSGGTPPG